MKSKIKDAGWGLFFKGKCKKNTPVCGYGGNLRDASIISPGHHSLLVGNTGYLLDANIYHKNIQKKYALLFNFKVSIPNIFFKYNTGALRIIY